METESNHLLNEIRLKHEMQTNAKIHSSSLEGSDGLRMRLRALLVALLGISMSACAIASQPVELELEDDDVAQRLNNILDLAHLVNCHLTLVTPEERESRAIGIMATISMSACAIASQPVELEQEDDDVAQRLNNVSFARRITKPTIHLVMGYGKLSAFVTTVTSLLLLMAVMSKVFVNYTMKAWWRRGARWLAAPALLVTALEATSDASDAMIAAVLRGASEPGKVAVQTAAAILLVTIEILVWYFIAKFFEYNPPLTQEEREKLNMMQNAPHYQMQTPPQV